MKKTSDKWLIRRNKHFFPTTKWWFSAREVCTRGVIYTMSLYTDYLPPGAGSEDRLTVVTEMDGYEGRGWELADSEGDLAIRFLICGRC